MRVVYDYGMGRTGIRSGVGANIPSRDTAGEVRRETVLVISRGRADSAYDLSLSDRARAGDSGVDPTSPEYRLSDDARMRDREVRAHERAHARTLGPYASSPIMYDSASGPDGETVATGGRVGVDLSPVPGDPDATLRKARVILNAARAPGDPSAADMRVAAEAYRLAQSARADIREQTRPTDA